MSYSFSGANAVPIYPYRTLHGGPPAVLRLVEHASGTFKVGTPVFFDTDGAVKAWSGVVVTSKCAGIAAPAGSNLSSDGVAKTTTFGSVRNQSSAVNIPRGAPLNDGKITIWKADPQTQFVAAWDDADTPALTDIGTQLGLAAGSGGYWAVDQAYSDSIVIDGILDGQLGELGGLVIFHFIAAACQF
jgi:hypothetical protein